jgi:predicted DCC family thiol-disulfide oxidoreductase YuxK
VPSGPGVLVFDGDCAFCTTAARWIERRWPPGGPTAVAWQSLGPGALGPAGPGPDDLARAAWWIEGTDAVSGSAAVARALNAAGGGWTAVSWVLVHPPGSWVAPAGYRLVARNRHRLPGGTAACAAGGGTGGPGQTADSRRDESQSDTEVGSRSPTTLGGTGRP